MNTVSNQCLNQCGQPVAAGPGRTGKFCGRSCANSYNNRVSPKRKPEHSCKTCGAPVSANFTYCSDKCKPEKKVSVKYFCTCGNKKNKQSEYCQKCRSQLISERTLGELKQNSVRHAQVYNRLRQASRRLALQLGSPSCIVCSYSKHVEVAHITPLCQLPDETTVAEAIGPHNFILLCPNHHWEFDHGGLTLAEIQH